MAYSIIWSKSAAKDLEEIIAYIAENWGDKALNNFKMKLTNRLNLLTQFPKLHQSSATEPKYRRSVLTKQVSIIYSVNKESIYLIRLFDNRQNPESLD